MADMGLDAVWLDVLPSMQGFFPALKKGLEKGTDAEGKSFGKRFGTAVLAGTAVVATGAVAVTKVLYGIGAEFSNMRSAIARETGAAGADLDRLVDVSKRVATRVPGNMETIGEATAAVSASIGDIANMTNDALASATVDAVNFSKAFEVDMTRAAQVASQMVKGGMARDMTQAFDLMVSAAQKVPPALREDILDAIDEYGPSFRQLGFSGEQAMSALVTASEKGMYGIDKTGDALKEFTIRATDMSTTSQDAYKLLGLNAQQMSNDILAGGKTASDATQLIIDKLLAIKDPATRANAAISLFGTPLEDLGTSGIPKFLQQLQSGTDALDGYSGSASRLGETLLGPQERLELLRNELMVKVKPAADAVFNAVNDGLRWLIDNGLPVITSFIDEWERGVGAGGDLRGVVEGVFGVIRAVFDVISQNPDLFGALAVGIGAVVAGIWLWTAAQTALNVAMSLNPIGIVVIAIAALVAGILYLWNTNEDFRNGVLAVWGAIQAGVGVVVDWFTNTLVPGIQWVWGQIVGAFESAGAAIQLWWNTFIEVNRIMVESVIGFFKGIWDWISGVFSGLWRGLVDIFGGPLDTVRKVIEVAVAAYTLGIRAIWDWLVNTFTALWGGIVDIFSGPLNAVGEFIGRFIEANKQSIMAIWTWISTAFARVWNGLYGDNGIITRPVRLARQFISDRIADIRNTVWGIWTWVQGKFGEAWSGLRDIISKPIQQAKDAIVGENGLLAKLRKGFDDTVSLVGKAWDKIKSAMGTPVKWVADNVVNPLIRAFNTVARAVGMEKNTLTEWNFKGFRSGGFTGYGRDDEWAGGVHRNEYVFDADTVRAAGGASAMDALRIGLRNGRWPVGPVGEDTSINQQAHRGPGVPMSVAGVPGELGRIISRGPQSGDKGLGGPVDWGLAMNGAMGWYRRCLAFVNAAWQYSVGRFRLATARQSMNAGPRTIFGTPPPGAGVYWDTGPSGHIALAVGDGTVLSNDIRVPGRIDRVPQQEINRWGPYRGWWHPNGLKGGAGRDYSQILDGGGLFDPLGMLTAALVGPLAKIGGVPGGLWGDVIGGLPRMIGNGMTAKVKEVFSFDQGGWFEPGMLGYSGLSQPEAVFTRPQLDQLGLGGFSPADLERAVRAGIDGARLDMHDQGNSFLRVKDLPGARYGQQTARSGRTPA